MTFATVYAFTRRHVLAGHTAFAIKGAWSRAVRLTDGDVSDGLCRQPIALCVAHATRILFRRDPRTDAQRIAAFYEDRKREARRHAAIVAATSAPAGPVSIFSGSIEAQKTDKPPAAAAGGLRNVAAFLEETAKMIKNKLPLNKDEV